MLIIVGCSKSDDGNNIAEDPCVNLITDTLGTNDPARIFVPTAFTPNEDGLNETRKPILYDIASFEYILYDMNYRKLSTVVDTNRIFVFPTTYSLTAVKYYYRIQGVTNSGNRIGHCGEIYKLTCLPVGKPASYFKFADQLTNNGFTGTTAEVLPTCP